MEKELVLKAGVLLDQIRSLGYYVKEVEKTKVYINTDNMYHDYLQMVTPETKEIIDTKLDEIKQVIYRDLNNQLDSLEAELKAL